MQWLYDALEWLAGLIASFFQGIYDLIIEAVNAVLQLIYDGLVWIFDKLWWFFTYLWNELWEFVVDQLNAFFQAHPMAFEVAHWGTEFHTMVNYFLPLNEFIGVCSVLFFAWGVCWVIKVTLKAVPTIY